MGKYRRRQYILGTAFVLVAGLALLLWRAGIPAFYACLLGVNATTLLLYGYDKRQAIVGGYRVPESLLHGAALLGGSPAALVGQGLFRHKTRKRRFQAVFVAIVLLQVAAIYAYWFVYRAPGGATP